MYEKINVNILHIYDLLCTPNSSTELKLSFPFLTQYNHNTEYSDHEAMLALGKQTCRNIKQVIKIQVAWPF